MGSLLFRCPKTDREIDVGISTDRRSLSLDPFFALRRQCPACGDVHHWHAMEGRIVPEGTLQGSPSGAPRSGLEAPQGSEQPVAVEVSPARRELADELVTLLTQVGVDCELWIGGLPVRSKTWH
jgi:hypothetical protein